MVKVVTILKGKRKKIIQEFPTIKKAKKFKRFVGREGSVKIFSRGKLVR